ncbi:MAG: hypothetical protein ACJAQT_003002 [Akkermansiaceae bacterium]
MILSIAIFFVFKIKKGEESAMVPAEHIPNSRQRASLESRSTRELSERSESQSRVGGVESDRFNSEVRQIIIDLNLDEKSRSHVKKSYVWKGIHYFVFDVDAIGDDSARELLSQCKTLDHLETEGDDGRRLSWSDRLIEEYGLSVILPFQVSISFDPEKDIVRYQRMDLNTDGAMIKSTGRQIKIDSNSNVNEGWRFAHLLEIGPQE